ncbi:MAG TPA: hypothetical protein VJV79_40605 [Polyangiaceae bacterium]|nr:hypothetical protein [Polyangiaceae bacterium]
MTLFSSLGARRFALLAVVFVIGVACAKVDRGYDDDSAGAGNGGGSAEGGSGGKAAAGTAGKAATAGSTSSDAGSAGEAGGGAEAGASGSAGDSSGGAAGAPSVSLTVALAGDGTGVVSSDLGGIDCGTTCSADFDPGTEVVLTATPAASSAFAGWAGGGCTGTGTCTTVISEATEVKATFTVKPTLTVVKEGTGLGTVTSVTAGINCGTDCSEVVNPGTLVTLNATVTSGTVFAGWSGGGCSGTGSCAVTVNAATQVTAKFNCSPGNVPVNYSGVITSFVVPACVTSLTIDAYGAQGGFAGTYSGGLGARMMGTFAVSGGTTLKVLVGGRGINATDTSQQAGGSGGGGTFVTTSTNTPLIVAGGGGGAVNSLSVQYQGAGLNASITTAGTSDSAGLKAGGVNGNGGVTGSNSGGYHPGTAGGGLLTNGVGNSDGSVTNYGTAYTPGFAFVNGGAGGQPGSCAAAAAICIVGRAGGFGGGGAGAYMGGGGGGYSGGASGSYPSGTPYNGGGGGGGSYNNGTAQTNLAGARAGHGIVYFIY